MYHADGEGLPGTYLEVRPPGTVIVGTPDVFLIVVWWYIVWGQHILE